MLERRLLLSGSWIPLTSSAPGPLGTMLLLSDGSVIAQISGNNPGNQWAKLSPSQQGTYSNGSWSQIASMQSTRLFDASQVLPSGKVFIAGGEYGTGSSNGELYDPVLDTWVSLSPQPYGDILDGNSILLPDGRVLIAPVLPTNAGQTIIFDPLSDTWSAGPNLYRGETADEFSWVKLPDDSILMVDGQDTSERYIPSLNQWVADAAVPVKLFDSLNEEGPAFLLPGGQAWFVGANGNTAIYTPSGSAAPGTWAAGPNLPGGLGADDTPAAMMPDGNILMALGPIGTYNAPTNFFTYNPTTSTFTPVTGLTINSPPFQGRMLMLPDGNVLYTDGSTSAWEYNPGDAPLPAAKPSITTITANADGTYTLSGTNFNGISTGATYGDDAQMDSNYPLVRLTDPFADLTYARTFNWSSTGVMTGSAIESTQFVMRGGITGGVQVVVNGVASDPVYPNGSLAPPTVVTPATPSPAVTSGATANLSVLGANPNGPESSLTYTWTTSSAPFGAPSPTFSVNATNSAKNTTATFYRAGTYVLQAIIQSPNGMFTQSAVGVKVLQTESGVSVSPAKATVSTGGSQLLRAQELDQFGQPMNPNAVFTWTLPAGDGTITPTAPSTALYTAPAIGTVATITADDGLYQASATIGVLPQPWKDADIGSVGVPGLAFANGNTFTISGSGGNIATDADQCQFVYQQISGDVSITARVTSEQNTGPFAYAGLMIRNSLLPNDMFVAINLTPANRTDFSERTALGNYGSFIEFDGSPVPYWLRLVRTGDTIRVYRSPDETGWTLEGSVQLAGLNKTVYVGLDVCAHQNALINTSTFDNISVIPTAVIGEWLFYNNSAFDGNSPSINSADGAAIATDKLPLAAGNTASVKNYTSYSKGINGLMIDVQDLPTAPPLSDFVFRAGNTANVSTWAAAPAVLSYSVLPGAGVNGSNRIEFTWPDGAIRNEWLQVTVASDTATGLHTAEVFYFGNLVGSATGSTQSQSFVVTSLDVTSARSDPHTFLSPAPVTDSNDFNRDGRVDALDQLIARASTGATLLDLTAPPTPLTLSGSQATLAPQAPQPDSILRRRRAVGAAPLG